MPTVSLHADGVCFVGLDVASRDGVAAIDGAKPHRFPLSAKGAAELMAWVQQHAPQATVRIVMEHTGVYSQAWARHLRAAGAQCALCNPAHIRFFAKGAGVRSKTDKADAKVILAFAQHHRPEPTPIAPAVQRQLAAMLQQLARYTKLSAMLNSQRHAHSYDPAVLELLEPELLPLEATIERARAELKRRIKQLIASDNQLALANQRLLSIPGVGPGTAAQLCAILSTVLTLKPKQLVALAGLAPAHRESGSSVRGKSHIDKQGRSELRCMLHMASLSAARCCPPLIVFSERLRTNGKVGMVIQTAVARRLLLIAQAVLKADQPFYDPALPA